MQSPTPSPTASPDTQPQAKKEKVNLAPFDKAVAGSTPFLFAKDFPGRVFKPAHPCERAFYDSLDKHPHLQPLVAKYYGTLTYTPNLAKPQEQTASIPTPTSPPAEYLVLEDLTHSFVHPCILDVKLGTTHHDLDLESPRAKPLRKSKYLTAPTLGFCLTGMQVYKQATDGYEVMNKEQGRTLTEETIQDKLRYFLHNGTDFRLDVVTSLIERLRQVEKFFENKPPYTFRSTSLLLLYEGDPSKGGRVDARMIDFAHAKKIPDSAKFADEYGYLLGTRNLLKILEQLIEPTP